MKIIQFSIYEKIALSILVLVLLGNISYHQKMIVRTKKIMKSERFELSNVAEVYFTENSDINTNSQLNKKMAHQGRKEHALFYFDPNIISEDSLKLLGLGNYAIKNLLKYREKGGKINTPSDLNKIYGLKANTFDRISPFIRIADKPIVKEEFSVVTGSKPNLNNNSIIHPIKINSATVEAFKTLNGIGDVFSERIINYRNALGGFYSPQQISEVYGISDSLYGSIKPYLIHDSAELDKIKINEVSFRSLLKHPYVNYEMTKAIINYRNMHGAFKDTAELKKIYMLDIKKLSKIYPYLDFTITDPVDKDQ